MENDEVIASVQVINVMHSQFSILYYTNRGYDILKAVLQDLVNEQEMSRTDQIILTGCSGLYIPVIS